MQLTSRSFDCAAFRRSAQDDNPSVIAACGVADSSPCTGESGDKRVPLRGYTSSVACGDSCLACGLGQVAALTVHRTVIHYRALRFATLKGKPLRTSDARPYGMRLCRRDAAESAEKTRFTRGRG